MSARGSQYSSAAAMESKHELDDQAKDDQASQTGSELDESADHDRDLEKNESALNAESGNKPPSEDNEEDKYLVKFEDGDRENPRNFSTGYKIWVTIQLGMLALCGSFGSSVISPADEVLESYLGVGSIVIVLTVSLYVLGFAVGPMMWAPISECYGRKTSLLPPLVALGLFSIGTAVSKNAASVFITRFFAGVFACAPISNVSAALGDLYTPKERGTAVAFYSTMVVGGPTLGPLVGAALTNNKHLGWRWTEYIEAIFAFAMVVLCFFCMPELYAPVLLARRARKLRKDTGDDRWHHPHEKEKITLSNVLTKYFSRPLRMLLTEPTVAMIAVYASFIYAILYMMLQVVPIIFAQHRHWGPVVSTLPFLAIFVGVLSAVGINLANQPYYGRAVARNKGKPVPEARLPPMCVGIILFCAGFFWLGWTSDPKYSWVLPCFALGFIGAGFNIVFQQCINILIDSYQMYAASAVAANTFLRSLMAAGLPLASGPMFDNLGVPIAATVLGAISCVAIPYPFLIYKYGERLRRKSNFAPT